MPCVRSAEHSGLRRKEGVKNGRAKVDWRWINWLRRVGVAANRVSVSGESVTSMSGMADRAVQGAAACRCSADPTTRPSTRSCR